MEAPTLHLWPNCPPGLPSPRQPESQSSCPATGPLGQLMPNADSIRRTLASGRQFPHLSTFCVFSDPKALEAIDKKGMARVPNFCVNSLFCLASRVDGVSKGSLQRYVRTHLNLPGSFCGSCQALVQAQEVVHLPNTHPLPDRTRRQSERCGFLTGPAAHPVCSRVEPHTATHNLRLGIDSHPGTFDRRPA
jgi:hypothetical protein